MARKNGPGSEPERTLRGIRSALDRIADRLDEQARIENEPTVSSAPLPPADSVSQLPPEPITPTSLAEALGHVDAGARIRAFLREPDDGGPDFEHRRATHWILTEAQAARVTQRFADEGTAPGRRRRASPEADS